MTAILAPEPLTAPFNIQGGVGEAGEADVHGDTEGTSTSCLALSTSLLTFLSSSISSNCPFLRPFALSSITTQFITTLASLTTSASTAPLPTSLPAWPRFSLALSSLTSALVASPIPFALLHHHPVHHHPGLPHHLRLHRTPPNLPARLAPVLPGPLLPHQRPGGLPHTICSPLAPPGEAAPLPDLLGTLAPGGATPLPGGAGPGFADQAGGGGGPLHHHHHPVRHHLGKGGDRHGHGCHLSQTP